jgi:hypothetical protein
MDTAQRILDVAEHLGVEAGVAAQLLARFGGGV